MNTTVLAVTGIIAMIVLLFARVPVAFGVLAVGFLGSMVLTSPAESVQLVSASLFGQFSSNTMVTVPLFILMGQVIYQSGMSVKMFDAAYKWFGFLPGGVAATTVAASIGFSTVSGSNAATTATMGSVSLPEMRKYNYAPRLAGGSVAIGGLLGTIIPPSTGLIIIAVQSEQSITRLFQASLIPGLLTGAMLLITVFVIAWIKPEYGPRGPHFSWKERFTSLGGVAQVLALFVVSIGGLFAGLFTPMEAAAVGALGAVVIAMMSRSLTWKLLRTAVLESVRISGMVIFLVASAVVFGNFLSQTRTPFELAAWVADLPVAPVVILLVVIAIYLLGGAFMDALGFLVISIPLFFPLITALGYDIVWFTILITLTTTIGSVTPPVGMNVFITSGVSKKWLDTIDVFRGVFPFFIPLGTAMLLLVLFPGIVTGTISSP